MLFESLFLILTNAVAIAVVMVAIFASSVPARLRLSLIATVIGLTTWQDTVFISNHIQSDLLFWNNIVFVWPTIAVLGFYIFTYQLNEHHRWRKGRWFQLLEWIPTISLGIGLLLQIVSLAFWQLFVFDGDGTTLARGASYLPYIIGLVISLLSVLGYLLLSVVATGKSARQRWAIRTVFYTVLIAVAYGLATNVVLPLVTQSQEFASFGILTVDIFAIGFVLSIVKGKLLNVKFYAVRTVVYLATLATLAGIYGVAAYFISQLLLGYGSSPVQATVNITLALLLAFIFQPIKRLFDKITNRIFYRDNYDVDTFFSQLNHILTTTSDLRSLLGRTAQFIKQTLKSEQAFFYIYHNESRVIAAGTSDHTKLPIKDARELDAYVVKHNYDIVLLRALPEGTHIRRLLLSHRIAALLPLHYENTVLGYLILGDHQSAGYTNRDIRTLQTIANELVIAIQNALSIQQVKDLNATLEHRVKVATSELRRSNSQLQRLDEAKDEFISMASHQLRTPLTSVKGYISMLLEGDAGKISPRQKHLLDEAFISSERMVRLIGDFLNVSRLQTGKFMVEKRPIDLATVVGQEIDSLLPNAEARGIKFVYKKPRNFPTLELDESKIRQVIMNFSDNAIYYSKDKSKVIISLSVEKNNAVFTVKDSGIGVPVHEQEQLFNKFFRATNARKQRPDGTGVGLFLAKKVVDVHGGKIIFESKEGKGSTFGFSLPIAKLRSR